MPLSRIGFSEECRTNRIRLEPMNESNFGGEKCSNEDGKIGKSWENYTRINKGGLLKQLGTV